MKKSLIIATGVLIVLLLGGAAAAAMHGALPIDLSNLHGPRSKATSSVQVEAAPALVEASDDVIADAVVAPQQYATLSMPSSGAVADVLVEEGDRVEAGQVLVRLDPTDAQLAVQQAEARLEVAQAQLALLRAGARPEEIAAAEAQLDAAQAGVAAAELARKAAKDRYDQIRGKMHGWVEEEAILQLHAAEQALEASRVRLNALIEGADDQLRAANASVWSATAQQDSAQAQLDQLQAGATAEEIAVAEAEVDLIEAALMQAENALAETELHAPFAGVVVTLDVRAGERVGPGGAVVQLADLSTLRIETDDLTELDVAQVQEGSLAIVTFDAIPDLELAGTVVRIKDIGEKKQGDVTYTVIVQLDEQDPRLRWNMTAMVAIEPGPTR